MGGSKGGPKGRRPSDKNDYLEIERVFNFESVEMCWLLLLFYIRRSFSFFQFCKSFHPLPFSGGSSRRTKDQMKFESRGPSVVVGGDGDRMQIMFIRIFMRDSNRCTAEFTTPITGEPSKYRTNGFLPVAAQSDVCICLCSVFERPRPVRFRQKPF